MTGQEALILAGVQMIDQPLYWTGAALLAGCVSVVLRSTPLAAGRMWVQPLYLSTAGISLLAITTAAANLIQGHQSMRSLAVTLAVSSVTALLEGTVGRRRPMQIAGVLLLAGAYVCEMLFLEVSQPQAFALPAGIALGILAFLQWRQEVTSGIRTLLEVAALALVLGTTLLQAVGVLGGAAGNHYAYVTLLLLEGTAVFFLGAALHWKRTFFSAGASVVASIFILLADPLRNGDEITVPTDSLFIETLPGAHPLLEDFKLRHRELDVLKVGEEVRKARLENLRLASRLLHDEREDPDIEKKIVVSGGVNTVIDVDNP